MNEDMRAQLTDFAAEFIAEAEQRAKEVFEKQIDRYCSYPKKQEIMNNW
jgi:hypothetical protein